jgi:lysophospholipase L1-like esterase
MTTTIQREANVGQGSLGDGIQLPWYKKVLYGIIFAVFMVIVLLGAGEVLLRILPLGAYRSAPFRQYDSQLGLSLIPNQHTIHRRGCFQGEVVTNRWGWRDRDRTLEKPAGDYRIAVLGDSAVEDVQVKPEETLNIQMEQQLRQKGYKNIEVLGFGVEGIGTTQELIMYKERVRQFHPDLVIAMFSWNDVMNNSSTLQPKSYGMHEWYAPYYDVGPNGELVFKPVKPRRFNGLRTFLERHSVLAYYLERMWLHVDLPAYNYKWDGLPIYLATYSDDPLDTEWKQAWLVTEKVMRQMQDTVKADGAKFVVEAWPSFTDIDRDWRERMIKDFGTVPSKFSPLKPEERLVEVANNAGVTLDLLAPQFISYRDAHHMQWPYFSFTCDPHNTPLGNEVSAQAIIEKLEQHQLLPAAAVQ